MIFGSRYFSKIRGSIFLNLLNSNWFASYLMSAKLLTPPSTVLSKYEEVDKTQWSNGPTTYQVLHQGSKGEENHSLRNVGGEDHQLLLNFLFLRCILVTPFVIQKIRCIPRGVQQPRTISPQYIGREKGQISIKKLGWIIKFHIMYLKMSS